MTEKGTRSLNVANVNSIVRILNDHKILEPLQIKEGRGVTANKITHTAES